jgi:hypothetical protein
MDRLMSDSRIEAGETSATQFQVIAALVMKLGGDVVLLRRDFREQGRARVSISYGEDPPHMRIAIQTTEEAPQDGRWHPEYRFSDDDWAVVAWIAETKAILDTSFRTREKAQALADKLNKG